jgi:ferredoxin
MLIHIVPLKDGGGGCGLEGMRILCAACHCKIIKGQKNNNYDNNQILLW